MNRRQPGFRVLVQVSVVAAALAALLLPATMSTVSAASCNGASHPAPTLALGTASPGSGTPTSIITFSVRYTDAAGCAPSVIEVLVSGLGRFALSGPAADFEAGVTYSTAVLLPSGSWPYRFAATSGSGPGERSVTLAAVSPSRVVIAAPTPKPTPKPTARPTAAPAPTPTPTRTPRPTAKPTGPRSTPAPTPMATASGTAPNETSPSGASPTPSVPGHLAVGGVDPGGRRGGPTPPANRAGGRPADAPTIPSNRASLGLGIDSAIAIPVFAWSLTTALGVILFAFIVRRPPPDGELGGSALAAVIAGGAVDSGGGPGSDHDARGDERTRPDFDPEAGVPRWLRPSIRAQRQSGEPGRGSVARQPARFAGPPTAGAERRTIGYRLVRVSDGPDDIRTSEVGRLDRGDEVEIIGERDGFLQVRTPSGLEGWVPRVVIVG